MNSSQMQYGSTSVVSNDDATVLRHNETNIDIGFGEMQETRRTPQCFYSHVAVYNENISNYQYLVGEGVKKMRKMVGGRSLFNFVIVFILVCIQITVNTSIEYDYLNRAFATVSMVISVIYLLTISYNFYIYRINGSLVHECMIEVNNFYLTNRYGRFFTIPVHARIENVKLIGASNESTTTILAQLQEKYYHLNEIKIMLCIPGYKQWLTTYIIYLTIGYSVLFSVLLLWSIARIIL